VRKAPGGRPLVATVTQGGGTYHIEDGEVVDLDEPVHPSCGGFRLMVAMRHRYWTCTHTPGAPQGREGQSENSRGECFEGRGARAGGRRAQGDRMLQAILLTSVCF